MIADLGTKRSASLDDVGPESQWICGLDWMSGDKSVFPVWTADELIQNAETEQEVKKEMISIPINHADPISSAFSAVHMLTGYVPEGFNNCYILSHYPINLNRFGFGKVICVLGLLFLFVKRCLVNVEKQLQNCYSLPLLRFQVYSRIKGINTL